MNFLSPDMRRRNLILSISLLLFVFISSCTKLERTTLGGDLLPGGDRLATDTMELPVETTSFIEIDTTVIRKIDPHILGFINDPLFGTTTAAMYFQMLPPSYPFSYPVAKDSLTLDSCVLSLSFSGTYGDSNAVTKVKVYKITDNSFSPSRLYRINEGVNFSPSDLLGTADFSAKKLRTGFKAAYKADTVFNQLRIRLSTAFAQDLLEQDNVTKAFRTDSIFKIYLRGFAVVPDSTSSGNALHYFTMNGAESRLNLYYRYKKRDGGNDTTVARFTFIADTIRSANANKIYRNYAGSIAEPKLTSGLPSSLAYVQGGPGTSVRIKVPALDTLKNKPYIIHRAEIVARQIYQGPLATENALVVPFLHLSTYRADGTIASIPFDSLNYFVNTLAIDLQRSISYYTINTRYTGGTASFLPDASSNLVAEFYMNITRYVQYIVNGRAARRDFKLSAPYFAEYSGGIAGVRSLSPLATINPLAYGRVQLGGGSHPQYRMYVRIYYSKQ